MTRGRRRRRRRQKEERKEKNFNEVVSNGYDDLLPLSHRQFVRASLRQGEEGGGNNAGLRRPSHSKSYRVLTIQITNTGLLPFLSSSSNPAYIALSGLPLFPSLSSSSSSTSKFMNVEKEAHLALSPVTSHLESFFTGSRFKYSFSSKATRASSNRRRLHGLSSLHSSSSSASKILKERGEEEEERRKATHGGLLSASSSSYLRESSVGDFSQASDRRLAANGDFPSVTSQGDLSKTSGENADLSLQKDPQKSEGGNERRREEPSLKRPLGISLENEEKENKGEKEKEIHEKERPNVFAFSDDWKSHLPAYAMWTESTTTRGAGGLGDTKKTSKEEEEEREERNFEDSSAHSLPSPPVILVEISKELHGRNRESRGQAGMLQLHLLIPLKEEEDLYMGQEREETSKSSSILASPSSAAVSACILEPPPSFLPSKKFLSSESRLKDEKSHPRGLKEDKNEMIDDGEDFFFCHCGARVWSEEKDSPHSQDLSTQKERRDRMKHKRQQEEALWLPFPLSIEDSRSNGTCASGLLAVNELERRRRNEKVSKRKKEKNSSSEEKKQNRLSSQQSPGVGLHPLSNSHLFSRSPSSVVDSSGVSTPQGPPHPSPPLRGGERESSREKMQVEKGEQDKKDELEEKLSRVSLSSFSSSPRVRKDELPTSSGDERKKLSLGPKTAKGDEGDLEKDQRRSEYKPYLAFLRSFSSGEDMVPCPLFYANRKFFIPFALLMLLVLIVVLLLAIHKRCIKICREGVVFVGVKQRIKLLGLWCKDQIHFLCCCLHMFFKRSRDRTSGVQLILIDEESSSTSTGRNSRHDRRGKSSSRQNLSKSAEGRGGQRHSRQHLSYSSSSSRGRSITSHTYPKQQEHPPHRQQRDGRPVFRQEVSPGLEREEDVFPETLDLPPQPSFSDYDGHLESPGYHASSHRTFFPLSGYPQQHEGGQILSQSQSAYEKIKKGRQAERQEKRELLPAVVGRHQHHHYDLP
ncbi:hypothetical protein CSUI_009890 [Cystoisospora suis]|uniref:Transmembrane protein n=1 Tax=Cystoisospora suis TaxID=483139 RepID=A0A2C6KIR3_9APIC|nr:hypothetical protein CSUI_009890 [Cystoisospora suis]